MGRLVATCDNKSIVTAYAALQGCIVAIIFNLFHQVPHEGADVLLVYAGILHLGIAAFLTLLTKAPHFDGTCAALPVHVEDHHHIIGGPALSTQAATKPSDGQMV